MTTLDREEQHGKVLADKLKIEDFRATRNRGRQLQPERENVQPGRQVQLGRQNVQPERQNVLPGWQVQPGRENVQRR